MSSTITNQYTNSFIANISVIFLDITEEGETPESLNSIASERLSTSKSSSNFDGKTVASISARSIPLTILAAQPPMTRTANNSQFSVNNTTTDTSTAAASSSVNSGGSLEDTNATGNISRKQASYKMRKSQPFQLRTNNVPVMTEEDIIRAREAKKELYELFQNQTGPTQSTKASVSAKTALEFEQGEVIHM